MAAATRVIAAQGLGAPTALIAKEAGVSNGSLFTYFDTKAFLLNQLYIELKSEMSAAALEGLPVDGDVRSQMEFMWSRWLRWATSNPGKRRTLAHLGVSDDITPESHEIGHQAMAGVAVLLERARKDGPMGGAPLALVGGILNAITDATVDFMIRNPTHQDAHSATAFEALWRMIA
ncbi:MAG: TetR/AcrR family transcriptional regulator [Sphingomonadales bacterium]|nr:TetR/AcrR family transcriptional regulator [Sphingomonadales bacterium]